MSNVVIADTNSKAVAPAERMERKFYVPPQKIGFAYTLLRQICRVDREFPEGMISSLYFDTPELEQYLKSASGDFGKQKVRIRWYDRVDQSQQTVPVFLELKSRQGFASSKQRRQLFVPPERLQLSKLTAGIIDQTTRNNTVAGFGYFPDMPLRPIITISYWRYRFNEILTGTRVSLDYGIRSSMVTPELGHWEGELSLPGAVIEVKGTSMELPLTLRHIKLLDTDWGRFSKYGACLDAHLSDPGSVARFSPNGKIIEL